MREFLTSLRLRLRSLFHRRRLERDLRDELAFHVAMREDELRSTEQGRAAVVARRRFGNATVIREDLRETWSLSPWLSSLGRDVRQGARALRHSPGFTTIAVLSLALAIGANTAMFSVLDAALLRPLPYPAADRLVMLWTERPSQGITQGRSAFLNVDEWRRRSQSIEELAFYDPASATLTTATESQRISVNRASPNLLTMFGVEPAQGRNVTWQEADERQGVAVISQKFWREQLGGASSALGSSITIDGRPVTVVGILPASFQSSDVDVWEPHTAFADWETRRTGRGTGEWFVLARLRPGVTLERVQAEATAIGAEVDGQAPGSPRDYSVGVVPLDRHLTGSRPRLALWMLMGAVFLVLLVAATNVASLSLTRLAQREQEIAIRSALGASRSQLIRQLLVESLLLAFGAGALGIALAVASLNVVAVVTPVNLNGLRDIGLNLNMLAGAIGLCVFTAILVGVAPAVTATRRDAGLSGREGSRTVTGGVETSRLRRTLIRMELALAVVLLVGAGLLLRSLAAAHAVDAGFTTERVLSLQVMIDAARPSAARPDIYGRILEEVRAVPGVDSAGLTSEFVIAGDGDQRVTLDGGATMRTRFRRDEVSPELFTTVRGRLVSGRDIAAIDGPASPPVVVVNESLARRLWPNGDAVGKRFRFGGPGATGDWLTVVGVVADMRRQGFELPPVPQMFESIAQNPSRGAILLVKTTSADPATMASAVRAAMRRADSHVTIYGVTTLDQRFGVFLTLRRFQTWLLVGFAGVALLLAAIGIYGLIYYAVASRTKEIAIRIAIGAEPGGIFRMVIGEGLRLAVTGVAIGVIGAVALGRVGTSLLFGVSATDPLTFAAVAAILMVVAFVACCLPARRAMRIAPVTALRES